MRSPRWVLAWLALAVLTCFLIGVASGLISDKVPPSYAAYPAPPPLPPWPHPYKYAGLYRVNSLALSGSGLNVGASTRRLAASQRMTGNLRLFMRTVKHGEPLALSGILTLISPTGEQLVYMTDLTSRQGILFADINGGSYLGPIIGSFTGVRRGREIVGIVGLSGFPGFQVRISR